MVVSVTIWLWFWQTILIKDHINAMEASDRSMQNGRIETEIVVAIHLPEGVGSDTNLGRDLTHLILTLTERIAPKFGVQMAADLAHYCVLELDASEGLRLFRFLDGLSQSDVEAAQSSLG